MQQITWLILGGTTFLAALLASRSVRALYVARAALGVLYVVAGALVHAWYLASGATYSGFADAAHLAFVRDTWESLVVPNHDVFIGLLVAFEAVVGLLILSGGRRTRLGLRGALVMHLGLLPFGWIISVWAAFMLVAIVLLLRAERIHAGATAPLHLPFPAHHGAGA